MPAAAWLMYKSAYVYISITEGSVKSSEGRRRHPS
jgi:hypothetical protein